MIRDLGQVMLYVNDTDKCAKFWSEKAKFEKVKRIEAPYGGYIYEVAPKNNGATEFVLQNKEVVRKMNPEMNLGTPSILMKSDNLDETYKLFQENGINVNPIMEMGTLRVFNFSDEEGNYFAVTE